ncbi:MAG: Sua5/YciO/YrdC/YwlC family protein [Candidatus Coatesbacteria bacterium]|nr:MAG: Sua5/YciO/YrdC/YwlC family protein [Candidatus Coatesbacteria bacterium]
MGYPINIEEVGEKEAAKETAKALLNGGLAITPTDTVYGLAALVYQPGMPCREVWRTPFDKLAAVKGREGPFIILLPYWDAASAFTEDDTSRPAAFAEAYGKPVTFLFNPRAQTDEKLTCPAGKVALRVVPDGFINRVAAAVGPIFSTSANTADTEPPRTLADVEQVVRDAAEVAVDGPPATDGPSGIADATTEPFKVFRTAPGLEEALQAFISG